MRKIFISSLMELAAQDERVVLLTADLGFMVVEPFRDAFPDRFFNVGVMEQNMIGLATGLAMNGYIPFVYSISTFAVLRPYEFIRNGPMVHNLPVRIVGVGCGVEYAHDGLTHHALEDVALMRTLPTFSIIAPADQEQTKSALRQTWNLPGPIYYRLSKQEEAPVQGLHGSFSYKEIDLLKPGKDCLLIASGPLATQVLSAAFKLEQKGVSCAVALISTIQPLNEKQLSLLLYGYRTVFSFEPHALTGGVGSLIAETIAKYQLQCRLIWKGISYRPGQTLGSQQFLYERNGLSEQGIIQTVSDQLQQ